MWLEFSPSTQRPNNGVNTFYVSLICRWRKDIVLRWNQGLALLASTCPRVSAFPDTPFLACCYGDLAASCVTRHHGNKTTKSSVFVWQWYEENVKQRYPFLLPNSTEALGSESSSLTVHWLWHCAGLAYNGPPPQKTKGCCCCFCLKSITSSG